jgi:hypothetical protein
MASAKKATLGFAIKVPAFDAAVSRRRVRQAEEFRIGRRHRRQRNGYASDRRWPENISRPASDPAPNSPARMRDSFNFNHS